jgi:hypothetical protein
MIANRNFNAVYNLNNYVLMYINKYILIIIFIVMVILLKVLDNTMKK